MAYQPTAIGHGYNEGILRIEHRPESVAHTKDELTAILDNLQDCGVDAWWYSVSAKGSYPLCPSKVLPYKESASVDYFPWLVEEAHRRGIVLFSWEYLNTAPLLTAQHPDWRVRYLSGPEIVHAHKDRHDHFACFNSPYGDLLKDFCVEVVNDLGFDGIWFDGCYQFGPADDGFRWSCCCERCAKKFRDETGQAMPSTIDWDQPAFREYIQWRYRTFTEYWQSLSQHVRAHNRTALIVYNFFNRHYMGAVSGSPLEAHKMDALIAGEGTSKTVQMQVKTLRAVSDTYPPEVWTAMHDGNKLSYPNRPNPDPVSSVFFAQAAATAGGYASFGVGLSVSDYSETLKAVASELAPLKGHIGGDPVTLCGLVYSGQTKDHAYQPEDGARQFYSKNKPVVDTVYGTGFMLDNLHFPYEIVLDNQLCDLSMYKVVILPDVQCMKDEVFADLATYVEGGGILVAIGECGTKRSDGAIRACGLLDSLFGISHRYDNRNYCFLEPVTDRLRENFPPSFMISGQARLFEVEADTKVLAYGTMVPKKVSVANHDKQTDDVNNQKQEVEHTSSNHAVAISSRNVGKGRAIYIAPSIGYDYSQNPNRRSREVFKRVIGNPGLPYTIKAPANVVVTAWRQEKQLTFHILNQPTSMQNMTGYGIALNPEDIPPTGPVVISVPKSLDTISSPYPAMQYDVERTENGMSITLPVIHQHGIVIIDNYFPGNN